MKIKFETIIQLFFISSVLGVSISYSKLYLFHIMLVVLVFSFLYIKINNLKFIIPSLPTRLHYIFYFMFIWYLLSIVWSINIGYTIYYLFYIVCGLAIVVTSIYYIRDMKTLDKVFDILSIVFIIEIIFSLLEAFTDFRLPVSPFSQYVSYFDRSMKIDADLDSNIISIIMESPTGFQWNPNNLSVTMLIIMPFFLLHSSKKVKFIGVISIFLIILMSGSRGIFIGFVFILFLYMLALSKKRFLIYSAIFPLLLIALLLNIDSLKNSSNQKVKELAYAFDVLVLYLGENTEGSDSIGVRQQLMTNGINALESSNYLGVGGGASRAVQEAYGDIGGHHTSSMHNFWIEMLVDSGVFFTLVFISWYLYIVLKLYIIGITTNNVKYRYYTQSLFLSMSGFTIGAISASSVIYVFPMWLMYGFSISIINNYRRYKNEATTTI